MPSILDRVKALGHTVFFTGVMNINMVVVRNPSIKAVNFDDEIYLLYRDPQYPARWCSVSTECTADPGRYYAEAPMNSEGTATICPGQYRGSHKMGLKNGRKMLQQCGPVRVWRDRDRDGGPDRQGVVDTGVFGLHVHDAGGRGAGQIGMWSAGCVVIPDPHAADHFFATLDMSRKYQGQTFTLTVMENE